MPISVFDLFSIGIGPSSSHTVGPMRAANIFAKDLTKNHPPQFITRIKVDLYGSLALTGEGHATDIALLLGLQGETPEHVNPSDISNIMKKIELSQTLLLNNSHPVSFNKTKDLQFNKTKQLPYHPNGMRFQAFNGTEIISEKVYYSIGGGFIVSHDEIRQTATPQKSSTSEPFPFSSGKELIELCKKNSLSVAQILRANEKILRTELAIDQQLLLIWNTMESSIEKGCSTGGILPGGLNLKRRAPRLYQTLITKNETGPTHAQVMEWVSLWALAVNEENAAGGRIVTAPTNGSAGVIPAVLKYHLHYTESPEKTAIQDFLLTAGAIGILYKRLASISAAEMGCMGEVGVACSMAAAGLAAVLGGSPEQLENAAEIGMEHNLGLTCDPIKGLVQIPCIERNTMGAVKAINAALLALQGDGSHYVSLDHVIATMRETGKNMQSIYKETSLGGLAVNIPEC